MTRDDGQRNGHGHGHGYDDISPADFHHHEHDHDHGPSRTPYFVVGGLIVAIILVLGFIFASPANDPAAGAPAQPQQAAPGDADLAPLGELVDPAGTVSTDAPEPPGIPADVQGGIAGGTSAAVEPPAEAEPATPPPAQTAEPDPATDQPPPSGPPPPGPMVLGPF